MFTGIIEDLGTINKLVSLNGGLEITVNTSLAQDLEVDDSLCINGVCQTVIARDKQSITVQAVEETLRKTTFDELVVADSVNLERALSLNTRIDGHIIQGHVDTTGTIKNIERDGTNWLIAIQYPNS